MNEIKQNTLPMRTTGVQHLIDRTYREGGTFQWARETVVNALQAGATRVHLGVEWQAVRSKGVYRRIIADDGAGMTADQLVAFFNVFGGGGKPIGGIHENFGVGAKTSLLPWNRYGLVVVSWVAGEASMIWVQQDATTGEYGLRLFRAVGGPEEDESLEAVVEPFVDPTHGVDWRDIKPDWLNDHGTVIVLLGNSPTDDTVRGDQSREEADLKGLAAYLNRRFLEVPEAVQLTVDELRVTARAAWPRSEDDAHGEEPEVGTDRRTNLRTVRGALHYIRYPETGRGHLTAEGVVPLRDGTQAAWFLWEGDRPAIHSYASQYGFIATAYLNELYDVTSHHAVYRSLGVADQTVRQRLWVIFTPAPYNDRTRKGVYPRTDRNALLVAGGPDAGAPVPVHTWAAEFAERMPEEIREALRQARPSEEGTVDDAWRDRIAERFGSRWRISKLRIQRGGPETVDPSQPGGVVGPDVRRKPRREHEEREQGTAKVGVLGTDRLGSDPGPKRASRALVGGGVPSYRTVHREDVGPGMLAAWQPHDPSRPEGVVLLNADHPVIRGQVAYWQERYAEHQAHDVEHEVLEVYGMTLVARVAHSEKMKGILPAEVVERDLRSEASLTMSMLGLLAEEQLIAARLSGKLGRQHRPTGEHQVVTDKVA